jgi:DNA-binding HxlR family transcriptional regulator
MTEMCTNDSPELIKQTLGILGDKYTALLIRLMHDSPCRFKDFEEKIPGLSPRTLSQRLDMLVQNGIAEKTTCPSSPGRYQYELTQAGVDLDDVLHSMAIWSKKHLKVTSAQ